MYKNVEIYDSKTGRWMDYTVTPTANKFNGYVEDNKGRLFEFSNSPYSEKEIPTYPSYYNVVPIGKRKPSIYKRPFLILPREEYKHVQTLVKRKVTEERHDLFYNARRNKCIDKVTTSSWFNETYGFSYDNN